MRLDGRLVNSQSILSGSALEPVFSNALKAHIQRNIAEARRIARASGLSNEEIHAARKSIKRARSTLRLMRGGIPGESFEQLRVALRSFAHSFTSVRDATVMHDRLLELVEENRQLSTSGVFSVAERLEIKQQQALEQMSAPSARDEIERVAGALQDRLECVRVDTDDWELLACGLKRIYRVGRRRFRALKKGADDDSVHRCRKAAKDLMYSLQSLTPMAVGQINRTVRQLHRLTDDLGEDHDLALLDSTLRDIGDRQQSKLRKAIKRRRAKLQRRARHAGRRLYERKPRRYLRHLGLRRNAWMVVHERLMRERPAPEGAAA